MIKRTLSRIKARLIGVDMNSRAIEEKELGFLLSHVGKNDVIMEIGCAYGQTTRRLVDNGNIVHAIDPFLPDNENGLLMGDNVWRIHRECIENIKGRNVILYPMTSEKALLLWNGRKIDFLFIDGEHSYNALSIDSIWINYIREGGLIAFHDCLMKEVNDFLREKVFPKYKFIGSESSLFIFQK